MTVEGADVPSVRSPELLVAGDKYRPRQHDDRRLMPTKVCAKGRSVLDCPGYDSRTY